MMQTAAVLWHVSLLAPPDSKGLALGMVGLARVTPIVAFSMLSGVLADVFDRRRLMMGTQTALCVVAVGLTWLAVTGNTRLWPIYLLSTLGGAASAFDGPPRQSLIPSLVPREHLPNAIGLNTIMIQLASVAGPSVAGLLISLQGVGLVYAVNAVSFVAVLSALAAMRDLPATNTVDRPEVSFRSLAEGLRFVFYSPLIRATMLLDFFATFFSSATALLPIFAQDILQVGPRGYGWLAAAPAVGSVVASLAMATAVARIERRGRVLLGAVAVYGVATAVFGLSRSFPLTMLCLAATGAADTVSTVLRNLIRQLATPDHLRGRMTGVNMVFFMGGPQLGELEAGLAAQAFGAPFSVVSGGIGCLIATAIVAWQTPVVRRYRRTTDEVVIAGDTASQA